MSTVRRDRLHDAQGDCLVVDLSGLHVDEKVAAEVILPPWRCLHLVADGDVTFSRAGVQRLVWRSGGRCIVTTDDLPPAMAEAYAAEALAWFDFLAAA